MKRSALVRGVVGTAVIATVFGLAACAPAATDEGPVTLTYWTWAPAVPDAVAVWNEQNPDIQVKVEQPAGADDIIAKVLAAQRAGEGPDLFAAEYQKVPNLVVSGAGYDISDLVGDFRDDFSDSVWDLVTVGDGVYGIPQDTGPMVYLYRADIFEQNGWTPPTTWDEYATLAAEIKTVLPNSYLGGYPDDGSTLAAYAQPLGAEWWSTDGESWSVDISGAETTRVAEFWEPLVRDGLIDTTHFFTPEWNTMMNDGTILSWAAGAWAPGTIASVAPDTAGAWKIAKMPSWDGETQVGLMGGSSAMIGATTEHPAEAAKFAAWLNGSDEGSALLAEGGLFPASIAGQEALTSLPVPDMVSGQADFWTLAAEIASDTASFTWGPNVQIAFDTWGDSVRSAVQNGTPFSDALDATQDAVVSDLETTGFTVK